MPSPPIPRRRRETPEVRIGQVLDAAEAVLLERGLAATTMADIASRAGVAKGTVYLYFDTRAALLAALRRRYVEGIEAAVRAAAPPGAERSEAIRAAVRALIVAGTDRPELHHLLFQEAGISEDDAFGPVQEALAELIAPGIRTAAAALTVEFLAGGIHAALTRAAHTPRSRRAHIARQVADLAVTVVEHAPR